MIFLTLETNKIPHDALHEKLQRLGRKRSGNGDAPRPDGLANILVLQPQRIALLLVGNRIPGFIVLLSAERGVGERPGENRVAENAFAADAPFPAHIKRRDTKTTRPRTQV